MNSNLARRSIGQRRPSGLLLAIAGRLDLTENAQCIAAEQLAQSGLTQTPPRQGARQSRELRHILEPFGRDHKAVEIRPKGRDILAGYIDDVEQVIAHGVDVFPTEKGL